MSVVRKTFVRLDGGLSTRPEPALLERSSLNEPGNPLESPNALNVHGDAGRVGRRRGCGHHLDTGSTGPVRFISTFVPWPVVGLTTTTIVGDALTQHTTGTYPTTGGGPGGGGGGGGGGGPGSRKYTKPVRALAVPVPVSPITATPTVTSPVTFTWSYTTVAGLTGFAIEIYPAATVANRSLAFNAGNAAARASSPTTRTAGNWWWRIQALGDNIKAKSSAWSGLKPFVVLGVRLARVVATKTTNADTDPTFDLSPYQAIGFDGPGPATRWTLFETAYNVHYGDGVVDVAGTLVGLQSSFTSGFHYDGYMTLMIQGSDGTWP